MPRRTYAGRVMKKLSQQSKKDYYKKVISLAFIKTCVCLNLFTHIKTQNNKTSVQLLYDRSTKGFFCSVNYYYKLLFIVFVWIFLFIVIGRFRHVKYSISYVQILAQTFSCPIFVLSIKIHEAIFWSFKSKKLEIKLYLYFFMSCYKSCF